MRILFQGDSITDCGRDRSLDESLGGGYPYLIKGALGLEKPGEYEFINKGVSGDRIVDVYARMKRDILNYKPDVMSLLIGVNDVWHEFLDAPNGVDEEKFFKIYDMLISEIKAELPDIKIMIMEPFVLCASSTEANYPKFRAEVLKRGAKAKMIAEKYNLPFIPLREKFDKLTETAPANYWLADGVHPTVIGHEFIKNEWLKMFKTL